MTNATDRSPAASTTPTTELPLDRVQRMTDVIFALTLTIIVFAIDIPDGKALLSPAQVTAYIIEELPALGVYVTTLAIVVVYWLRHLEHSSYLQRTNQPHIWLHAFYLGSLVMIPFSNGFSNDYPNIFAVQTWYSLNMFAVGLFSLLEWQYATRKHRLVAPDLDRGLITEKTREALMEPAVALASIGAAALDPRLWNVTLLLIPIVFVLQKSVRRHLRSRRAAAAG